jgi:hypothetical protein
MGTASLTWAFSEAAGLWLRTQPASQKSLSSLEQQPGPGHALMLLAQQCGRAVSYRVKRQQACARDRWLQAS